MSLLGCGAWWHSKEGPWFWFRLAAQNWGSLERQPSYQFSAWFMFGMDLIAMISEPERRLFLAFATVFHWFSKIRHGKALYTKEDCRNVRKNFQQVTDSEYVSWNMVYYKCDNGLVYSWEYLVPTSSIADMHQACLHFQAERERMLALKKIFPLK